MSRVLKADNARQLGSSIVFNFEDVQQRCEAHVAEARRRAAEIVTAAEMEVDRIRRTAREEGYRAGVAEGLAKADAEIEARTIERVRVEVAEEVRTVVPAAREVVAAIETERDRWLTAWEDRAIDLVIAIAGRIVRSEIARRPESIRETLSEVLRLVAGTERLDVCLNPDDLERLEPNAAEFIAALSGCASPTLLPDDSIEPGGCRIETLRGSIDATIATQLDRIAAELRAEDAP